MSNVDKTVEGSIPQFISSSIRCYVYLLLLVETKEKVHEKKIFLSKSLQLNSSMQNFCQFDSARATPNPLRQRSINPSLISISALDDLLRENRVSEQAIQFVYTKFWWCCTFMATVCLSLSLEGLHLAHGRVSVTLCSTGQEALTQESSPYK